MNVRNLTGLARWSAAAVCGAGLLYAIGCSPSTPEVDETSFLRFRTGELAQLKIPGEVDAPDPKLPEVEPAMFQPVATPPAMTFEGPDGQQVKLADFAGKVLVVNLWATWCAPCKVEMPTLAGLQAAYDGKPVKVIAISTDMDADKEKAVAQIASTPPLAFYHSPGINLAYEFEPDANSFPTTIIYDKKGVERARLVGDADWNTPEVKALIDALLAEA